MATKKEAKKKIKTEYKKLKEDIQSYINKGQDAGKEKAENLLKKVEESETKLVDEINNGTETSKKFFKDLFTKTVDQVDKEYKELTKLINK